MVVKLFLPTSSEFISYMYNSNKATDIICSCD